MLLLLVAAAAALTTVSRPMEGVRAAGLLGADRTGLVSAATLVIAVTAANLFHQGYWQRVWAAEDDRSLRRGALLGSVVTVPVVRVAGGFGMVAAGAGMAEIPPSSVSPPDTNVR